MIVMGQVVDGISIEDLEVGMPVRLVIDTLFTSVLGRWCGVTLHTLTLTHTHTHTES